MKYLRKKSNCLLAYCTKSIVNLFQNLLSLGLHRNYMKKMGDLGLVKVHGSGRWKIYEIALG